MKQSELIGKIILLLTIQLLAVLPLPAQSKAAQIDSLMRYCYENGVFNGAVLVAKGGEVLYKNAFGYADPESQTPLETGSQFYLASVSKQFTTAAILLLQERGKLRVEDPLRKIFPDFPAYADGVTIAHLMSHTSGIGDHFELGAYRPGLTNRDVYELLTRQDSLAFTPGERFRYSNGGYVLLALIVEKVSGLPYHQFMKANFFDPLGMTRTLVYDESRPQLPARVTGYNGFGDKDDYQILTSGAGGMYSTVEDLFRWDQALYAGRPIAPASQAQAYQPFKLNNDSLLDYGFGWALSDDGQGGKIVSHAGDLSGFRSYIERKLGNRYTIIFLTSKGDVVPRPAMRDAIVNILGGKSFDLPPIPIALKMAQLIRETGIDQAVAQYPELKRSAPDKYDFSESQLNRLGNYFLQKESLAAALEMFRLNAEAYPDSWKCWNNLGGAQLQAGNPQAAAGSFEKSLQLNSDNAHAREMLEKIRVGMTPAEVSPDGG